MYTYRVSMISPPYPAAGQKTTSPLRQRFLHRLETASIKPAARDYYVRWAESWTKARGHQSPERTQAYFDALGRSAHLADWQFRQAVDAARILSCDVLAISWASSFEWQSPRKEVRSVFARLEDPWKLIAQIMYGSGLRLMEAMRLRVKDLDFGQGTITIHQASSHEWDYARASHHYVPLRLSTRQH
jgi:integrase